MKKPAFLLHFYFVPTDVPERVWKKPRRKASPWKKMIWLLFLSWGMSHAATLQELNAVIANLDAVARADEDQGVAVIDAIQTVIAPPQSILPGTIVAQRSVATNLIVHYKASTAAVAGIQFDLVLPQGFTVQSVTPGLAAQAAGKGVQGNSVATGYRVIIFGLNTTSIPSGSVAVVRITAGGSVPLGKTILSLVNAVASSPAGATVALTLRQGSVTIK